MTQTHTPKHGKRNFSEHQRTRFRAQEHNRVHSTFGPPGELLTSPFKNLQFLHSPGLHFVGSTEDPGNPVGSRSVAEPMESLQLQVFGKTRISIFAKNPLPKLMKKLDSKNMPKLHETLPPTQLSTKIANS